MYDAIQFERQCRSDVLRFEDIGGRDLVDMVNIIDISRNLRFILLPGLAHSQGRDGYNFCCPGVIACGRSVRELFCRNPEIINRIISARWQGSKTL